MKAHFFLLGLAFVASAYAAPAHAQGNYRGSPQGGRSALMGGTGVALGRDGSIPFLNPAGLTRIETGTVSFSTNFFALSHTKYDRLFQPNSGAADSTLGARRLDGTSYTQTQLDSVPSTLCLHFRLGKRMPADKTGRARFYSAFCFGSTERSSNDGFALPFSAKSGATEISQSQTFTRSFRRFMVGPTLAVSLKERWSLGAALHLTGTSYYASTSSSNVSSGDLNDRGTTLQTAFDGNSYDLALRLGASYKPDRHVTFGLSVQLPALHVLGSLYATQTTTQLDGAGGGRLTQQIGKGSFRAGPPPSIATGVGIESWPNRIESDLFVYFPLGSAFQSELDITTRRLEGSAVQKTANRVQILEKAHAVVDAAIGVEHYLNPSFSLLGGFSTDFSANPPLSATPAFGSVMWSRSSRASVAFGAGSYGGSGEILFGTELSFAKGKAYMADSFATPNQLALVNQSTWTAMFILAGKTSFAKVRQTVDRIRSLTVAP